MDEPGNIMGKSVVIHELKDSCNGPTGNAGKRQAQCVIGIANVKKNKAAYGWEYPSNKFNATCHFTAVNTAEHYGNVTFKQGVNNEKELTGYLFGLSKNVSINMIVYEFGDLTSLDNGGKLLNLGTFNTENGNVTIQQKVNVSIDSLPNIIGHSITLEQVNKVIGHCVVGHFDPKATTVIPTTTSQPSATVTSQSSTTPTSTTPTSQSSTTPTSTTPTSQSSTTPTSQSSTTETTGQTNDSVTVSEKAVSDPTGMIIGIVMAFIIIIVIIIVIYRRRRGRKPDRYRRMYGDF